MAPNDGGLVDSCHSPFGMFLEKFGIPQSTLRVVLPEIDTIAQPIVVVTARPELIFGVKNLFAYGCVTSVKTEGKGGKRRVHRTGLLVMLIQISFPGVNTGLFQECFGLVLGGRNFLCKFLHVLDIFFSFFLRHDHHILWRSRPARYHIHYDALFMGCQ